MRYVCHYKLAQLVNDLQQLSMFGRDDHAGQAKDDGDDPHRKEAQAMLSDYTQGRWNGDRDAREGITDDLWKLVTTDRHGCINRACPSLKTCAQVEAKKRLRDADVIVANHDLLLADLAMGGGVVLPNPKECFYVIDEAHNLPGKAVAAFASSHFVQAGVRNAEKIAELAARLANTIGDALQVSYAKMQQDAQRLKENLEDAFRFFSSLEQLKPTEKIPRPKLVFERSCLPEGFFDIGENITSLARSLTVALGKCEEYLGEQVSIERARRALFEKLLSDVGFYAGRLGEIFQTWTLMLRVPSEEAPPVAKWIEAVTLNRHADYQVNASPVLASDYLRELLWESAAGVVLTSATITTLGNFDDYLGRTGLKQYGVACLELASPFNYAEQAVIEIPRVPAPKHYAEHTQAVLDQVIADMNRQELAEGMLVLFMSRRQMEDVAGRLPKMLKRFVLVQGDQSKSAIIAAHRSRVDSGSPSVIFGMASFCEGVDLPAQYCTQVLITKLPFDVPDSPVMSTLCNWIQRRGGNPFFEISVPDAARRLEQCVGRLIRTEADHGRIVVTDPRLWGTRYGRDMLRGLPPFRVMAMGKEVTP
jgi:ATP-dependent DNA helicase DinG